VYKIENIHFSNLTISNLDNRLFQNTSAGNLKEVLTILQNIHNYVPNILSKGAHGNLIRYFFTLCILCIMYLCILGCWPCIIIH